jgi:linoleate 8R-lipoxygenase/9,12-octadecadienoate 8-hydroperoxide 8R-isomerase/linoleate 8R-lipoxygenase/9,12-octadecadienoate 8-hydroperoxide 8S-isomerase
MHKLIFRAFPNHFEYNSIYAHFPFVVPSENKVILEALDTAEQYSWAKPARKIDPVVLKSHKTTTQVLSNNKDFYVPWGQTISYLVTPPKREPAYARQFCLSGDGPPAHASRDHVKKCLYAPSNWNAEIAHFYQQTTTNFLHHEERRVLLPGGQQYEADIVRDVINPLNTRFIAAFFGMPIKTAETPHGIFTEFELYNLLTAMFASVFFDSDPANSFKLKTTARKLALQLEKILVLETEANSKAGWVSDVAARIGFGGSPQKDGSVTDEHGREWPNLPSYGKHLVSRMMEKGKTIEECVAGTVVPMSAAGATILSGLLSQCLDYFLGDGSKHLPELYRLAHEDSEEADELLTH